MLVLPHSAQPMSHRGLLPATPQPTAAPSGSQTWSCDCTAFHEYFLAVSSSSSAFVTYKGKKKKEKLCIPGSATGPAHVKFSSTAACLWIAPEPPGLLPSMGYSSSCAGKAAQTEGCDGFVLRRGHALLMGCPCAPLLRVVVVEMGWAEMPPSYLGMPSLCCHDARHQTHLQVPISTPWLCPGFPPSYLLFSNALVKNTLILVYPLNHIWW